MMAEEFKLIEGVNLTSTEINCPGCGGTIGLQYDPSTATMTCPFCGLASKVKPPEEDAVAKELDFNSAMQRASVNWGNMKKLIVCSNCGGQALYDAEQITGACPFCGSTSVAPAAENKKIMAPNAVIPFSISREEAQNCFTGFLKRKRCVSKKIYDCKLDNLVGIYLPFWTYDTLTVSSVISVGVQDRKLYKGTWTQYIDDVVIYASQKVRHPYISRVQNFNFEGAVPYSPKYLAGIPAERYTVGLNDGWERTTKIIRPKLIKAFEKHHEHFLVNKLTTDYYNVRFRYLLAPIYLATYTFKGKTLQVAINGQTGQTYCEAPTWIKKIIWLGIFVLVFLSVLELVAIIVGYSLQ